MTGESNYQLTSWLVSLLRLSEIFNLMSKPQLTDVTSNAKHITHLFRLSTWLSDSSLQTRQILILDKHACMSSSRNA